MRGTPSSLTFSFSRDREAFSVRRAPAGVELLTTARPRVVVVQHAPGRARLDDEDRFGLRLLERHLRAVELLSRARVVAVAVRIPRAAPIRMPLRRSPRFGRDSDSSRRM